MDGILEGVRPKPGGISMTSEHIRIVNITFVGKKDAQEILHKLWKDEYLDMEKVVSHAAGQKELFLWKVKKVAHWEHILNDKYHAALNLSQKIAYNIEQEHEVLQRREKPEQLKNSRMILELSLLKLDDALLLFHDL
ncbi:uncharacterized protein [Elaeis guineensis]|nr:uncharacterized protein LOC105043005 isoform X2 [Elaeis guineensis]XP_029120556.1 uncharacterized protein LOC105043005 isoform X2 [Elaeis guineensis]